MMGDTVNLAARLEGANKFYRTYSMISEYTYELAKDFIEVRELDKIRVVGKKEPVRVYELLEKKGRLAGNFAHGIEFYLKALELYKQRRFADAIPVFESVLKVLTHDGPSETYIERCKLFVDNPPDDNWDGVFKLTSKG